MMEGTVHPRELAGTLANLRIHPQELTAAHILPFVPQAAEVQREIDQAEDEKEKKRKQNRLTSVVRTIAECATVHAAATWVMENEEWDFFAVYYDAIDHFGHGFMRFHPPRQESVPEELFERYNYVVTAGYRFHDMMLRRLLHLAGPDTTVILVSDHGFHPDHLRPKGIPKEPAGPAVEHRDLGVICMRGPHIQQDERVYGATLLDVAPTVLTLFGLPVGRDMDGRPLAEVFDRPLKPDYIPTWEAVAGESGMYPPEAQQDPWAEQAALERLIELGYVEPPGEDKREAIEKSVRESRFYLARVYLSTRRRQEALPILEELYEQAPEERRYALRLAQCYRDLSRLVDCRRVIEEVLAREEESFPALDLLQGTLLLAEEEPQEALVHLEKAGQADSRRSHLHQRIGSAYLQMKEWGLAEQAFRKALEIDPDSAQAYRGLAVATLRQQRFDEAAAMALASVGRIYHNPSGHFYLGEALLSLGEYERAAEAYRVAVAQEPGMRRAHLRLARLYRDYLDEPSLAEDHRRFAEERIQTG
jgi:tetratricopeptide (TPR) repeat protein